MILAVGGTFRYATPKASDEPGAAQVGPPWGLENVLATKAACPRSMMGNSCRRQAQSQSNNAILLLRAAAPRRVASSNGSSARHAPQVQTHNAAECMSLLENVMAAGCARRFQRPDTPHRKRRRPTGRAAQHLCYRACNTAPELRTCRTARDSNCATHSDYTSCAFHLTRHGSLQLTHHGN